jgi:hypothetical protein
LIRLRLRPSVTLALAFPRGTDLAALVPLLDTAPAYILELAGGWRGLVESASHVALDARPESEYQPLTIRAVQGERLCAAYDLTGNFTTAAQVVGVHQSTVARAVKARAVRRERELCLESGEPWRRRRAS